MGFTHTEKYKDDNEWLTSKAHFQGLSQAAVLRQSRTVIEIVLSKNGQGDNLSPSKLREKTQKCT